MSVSALLSLAFSGTRETDSDIVERIVGIKLSYYYMYMKEFGTAPIDLDDLADGLLYMAACRRIREKSIRKAQIENEMNNVGTGKR